VNAADPADDVKVICYVSVGEDSRSAHVTDQQARLDPRFIGDGTGPRVDPRGPNADGKSLAGIDPRGASSNGGSGFASFYLDDDSMNCQGQGDGIRDRNFRLVLRQRGRSQLVLGARQHGVGRQ
jgi:hypothetical protein